MVIGDGLRPVGAFGSLDKRSVSMSMKALLIFLVTYFVACAVPVLATPSAAPALDGGGATTPWLTIDDADDWTNCGITTLQVVMSWGNVQNSPPYPVSVGVYDSAGNVLSTASMYGASGTAQIFTIPRGLTPNTTYYLRCTVQGANKQPVIVQWETYTTGP